MKRFYTLVLAALLLPMSLMAQGWPANYSGVMLQGFYWDSFIKSKWTKLEGQAGDFKGYFDLVWVPQSGKCLNSTSMGYDPYYYFDQNSSFGTQQDLKSMISTFKANGIGTIADVVINHHNTKGWWGFPAETYNGVTYQLKTTDIVANDCNGKTKTQADKDGVSLSSNPDEGEGWDGMRDLDHKSANVQNIVKAYQQFLVKDLGYVGFRYDMVKGFWASRVRDYNNAAGVEFSVGEFWDGSSKIKQWIDYTEKHSAAFDFDFKYTVTNAANSGNWNSLGKPNGSNWPIVSTNSDQSYYRYAVTFIENHDTEKRDNGESNGALEKDTLAANAFLLAMPGTPCVFYKHYLAYPYEIKAMIDARKTAGITNTSSYSNYRSAASYFGNIVTGSKGKLLVMVGANYSEPAANRYVKILSGHHYAYYLSPNTEVAFADKPSGTYTEAFNTKLTAVSAESSAQLVYTTDGSTPSATNGKVVAGGTSITISDNCTLKVGLLVNGSVTSTTTRNYTFAKPEDETFETPPAGYTFSANFIAPATWSADIEVHAWAWIEGGANYTPDNNAHWPGDKDHVYRVGKSKDGGYIWKWCYYGSETVPPSKIIFNNGGNGTGNQTADMVFTDNGWYNMNSTQSDPTLDIKGLTQASVADNAWYTLTGVKVARPTQKGIYIHHGKKVIIQ
ncbi:alpha amylase, catalytic domain protein [Bacteroidales bacterium KA00344]|nr:alpha amylase, catalytic domain protein [Bacteroidales bacterium KA00344]